MEQDEKIKGIGDIIVECYMNSVRGEQHYIIIDQNYYQYELLPLNPINKDYQSSFLLLKSTVVMYYIRVA